MKVSEFATKQNANEENVTNKKEHVTFTLVRALENKYICTEIMFPFYRE